MRKRFSIPAVIVATLIAAGAADHDSLLARLREIEGRLDFRFEPIAVR